MGNKRNGLCCGWFGKTGVVLKEMCCRDGIGGEAEKLVRVSFRATGSRERSFRARSSVCEVPLRKLCSLQMVQTPLLNMFMYGDGAFSSLILLFPVSSAPCEFAVCNCRILHHSMSSAGYCNFLFYFLLCAMDNHVEEKVI